ncbi:MAG: hypothetical protein KKI06_05330 [Euryarchaeota archaeon]|nr:hypothetical protein [Euryarchaeota archaeon]MBU4221468.1 hypothetical protein [Euryarchaeota archaeon]
MILLQSPQKKVESILKEVEKGKTHGSDTSSLMQILNKQPSMIPEVIRSLASIMAKGDSKPGISACLVMNRIADERLDEVSDSLEIIMDFLKDRKKELNEYEWIPALELLTKINQQHPEKMGSAVPALLAALGNTNATVKETAYYLLSLIAADNPDFFKDRSIELIKVLNGLNVDERIHACNIIGIIAEKKPEIVDKTFDLVNDFFLNHPDNNLRSAAGLAADKMRPKKAVPKQPESKVPLVKQEEKRPEINITPGVIPLKNNKEIGSKDKSQIENALQLMIPKSVIESAILIDTNGGVIAQSGPQMDNSLLKKLASMISSEGDDEFKNRISIEQADKKIVAVRVGNEAMLVVVTSADTAIGMLLVILNKSVEKIKEILMDAGA